MTDTARRDFRAAHLDQPLVERLDAQRPGRVGPHDEPTPAEVVALISRSLQGSLDVLADVSQLARVVVPFLGTWSIVSMIDADGVLYDAGSWHEDPALRDDVAAYSRARLRAFVGESFIARVARTGEPVVLADRAYETVRTRLQPGAARDLLDRLRPSFVVVLPMIARGHTIGLLSVYSDTAWTAGRREVADDIVARAALMIDNSLAYERERAARAAAEAAEQRLSLLAQVSETLATGDDPDVAVGELARLVVPALADWAFVTVIREDGTLSDIGLAHRDPAMAADLAAYSAQHLEAMSDDAAVARALRTGVPVIVPRLRPEILASFLPDPHVAELTRRLAPYGVASFPLTARGRTLGALTLATTANRGPHTADEVALGLEISRRAGPVLDAARAAHSARSLAESLQRSMLAIGPSRADLHIATRYRPASFDREIGGDWYDAFGLPGGATLVSIGDAMGHDVAAIAAMAQLRTLMRAAAWTVRHSPAEILGATDAASVGLGPGTFATALAVELQPTAPDGSVDVRWSGAGHLPPIVVLPDGTVEIVRGTTRDLPLGVLADRPRHDHTLTLASGSVLLLYTDGLIERRDRDLDIGLDDLVQVLSELYEDDRSHDNLEALLDALLFRLMGEPPHNDDAALLAVRIGAAPSTPVRAPQPAVAFALPATHLAPGLAREFVAERCRGLPPAILDDLLVLVSEVVTNAVRYARPEFSLDLTMTRDVVRITVNDCGPELLVRHLGAPDLASPGGRGLLIVGALAAAWGVRHVDGSEAKSVWFELPAR